MAVLSDRELLEALHLANLAITFTQIDSISNDDETFCGAYMLLGSALRTVLIIHCCRASITPCRKSAARDSLSLQSAHVAVSHFSMANWLSEVRKELVKERESNVKPPGPPKTVNGAPVYPTRHFA